MPTTLPEPRKFLVPLEQQTTVRGYKTLATYTLDPATAFLAVKDNAKRQTWRVRVTFTDGRADAVKTFMGRDSLDRAKTHAYWSVMPQLTPEQMQALL